MPLACWSIDSSSKCSSHITARSVLPLSTSTAPAAKAPDVSATSRLRGRLLGFGVSGLPHSWYLVLTPTIPFVPSTRSSTNAASKSRRLLRLRRIKATRRVREAHVGNAAWCVRPPGVDCPVGEPDVTRQVAEQVEAQRRRPEEVGPQPLVI